MRTEEERGGERRRGERGERGGERRRGERGERGGERGPARNYG